MPEWLSTDNIAIGVLLAGYIPAGLAIRTLWKALAESRKAEAAALREGIELDRSYTAQLDSMSAVMSSVQTAIASMAADTASRLDGIEAIVRKAARAVVRELKA